LEKVNMLLQLLREEV